MDLFRVGLCLLLAITYSSGCSTDEIPKDFTKTTFEKGVYVSIRGESLLEAFSKFKVYSYRGNYQFAMVHLGPLIVQVEKPCGTQKYLNVVFSRKIDDKFAKYPPQPFSKSLKIDYQLGTSGNFYSTTKFLQFFGTFTLEQFINELACNNITVQDKWFYMVFRNSYSVEYRVQEMTSYLSKKKSRCPPDDSNIEKLCTTKSDYSCPNMTFKEEYGISVRNVSMYIVTGEPTTGKNCSFNSARYTQYMGNHYYFMGKNSHSRRMLRTIPVMTKAIRVSDHDGPCPKKYQMQFYVNTKHFNESDIPCPTEPGVLLQKVEHMTVYVKTLNGNPDTDMSQAKGRFTEDLDILGLPYIKGVHYISQYRGHGPLFGRTMEIWVEKTQPRHVTVCQGGGSNGSPKTTIPSTSETTMKMTTTTTEPMTVPLS